MSATATMAEFEAMLNESLEHETPKEGTVVKGIVIAVENGQAIIDVGFKVEGRVDLKEFADPGKPSEIVVGDEVEVFLDRVENARGEAAISREKARREEAWDKLEKANENEERVEGAIFGRVKGGFTVDLGGAVAFLPGSQIDVRPVRDVGPLMGVLQPFQILKMDRRRGNIVVSRRAVLEESRAEQRAEIVARLSEGDTIDGVVKNVTDYGAFVDLGGVDGLLHVTDMAWRRVNHPSEIVSIGETIKVQVIRVNKETQRISLGMKQLMPDPWESVTDKYPIGTKFTGRVTNITDYGAFVELEPGVEGLVHVSEMSWTKKNAHPGKIVSTSQQVEIMVLDVDPQKRRVSLGLKQCMDNPWDSFAENFPAGTEIEGEVKNITEFGLFIGLEGGIDGMVHLSDLAWERSGEEAMQAFTKGDLVKAVVLDVDTAKERISLGIKQLEGDPFTTATKGVKRGQVVTVTVTSIEGGGIEVEYDGMKSFIRRSDLSRDR
ncbi:MAG: 30S ribosomal protein S1, partial [Proteobacteria bacterium]|nr:30S ribosomal protein S1 [Pseudomonadota bacterium]